MLSYVESFNARLRDELLDGEIFYSLQEAKVVIERVPSRRMLELILARSPAG